MERNLAIAGVVLGVLGLIVSLFAWFGITPEQAGSITVDTLRVVGLFLLSASSGAFIGVFIKIIGHSWKK